MDPIVCLVLQQVARADCHVYLGARDAAALATGPTHELRLEIHAADVAREHAGGRGLALHAGGGGTLDRLLPFPGGSLRKPRPTAGRTETTGQTSVSICGLKLHGYMGCMVTSGRDSALRSFPM